MCLIYNANPKTNTSPFALFYFEKLSHVKLIHSENQFLKD